MPKEVCGEPASVLVVVDGEDDGTGAEVRAAGHYACIAPVNRGQGAALRLGYRIAHEYGASFIVTLDADGQTDPGDLEVILEPVVSGRADLVNGSRRLGRTHGTDAMRNLGVVFFAAVISFLTKTPVTDREPVRGFRAGLPAELVLEEPQYQAQELLIAAIMHGCRFEELPVTMRARLAGQSKKSGNSSTASVMAAASCTHGCATPATAGSAPGHLRRRGDGVCRSPSAPVRPEQGGLPACASRPVAGPAPARPASTTTAAPPR